ncbi:uncharacterized protein LOC115075728 isoform X3 [Rhinatrema bivittatum]|uniref:uncharacterized protein LOC115075728 isoform X3 n=1 Tax=Rhinatrema bivittatum TaxID=194408 RepID=UPI00112E85C2|nr:uncharacterized protein LOC115075728 isoform X3 [Rhinatrema bivittatum]
MLRMRRLPNFSEKDVRLLAKLMKEDERHLFIRPGCMRNQATTDAAWQALSVRFNAQASYPRDVEALKTRARRLRREHRALLLALRIGSRQPDKAPVPPVVLEEVSSLPAGISEFAGRRRGTGCAWIVGYSFIHRAQRRALKRPYGEDLELERLGWQLAWYSRRGMLWDDLLPFIQERMDMWGIPNILLIHLGGNDVGSQSCRALLTCIKKDLAQIMIWWPQVRVGWSDIIVRLKNREDTIWQTGVKKLNRQMGKWMGWEGGFWVRQPWSWGVEAGLFSGEGVHLSEVGMDFFNNALHEGPKKEIGRW